MQCQQPLFGISFPYPGQYFPNNSAHAFNGLAPDVIGEGEVNSITFPDGSIQYYFLPVRWHNMFYNYKPNPGLWIIKNFSNTISPVYNQYWQKTNPDSSPKPCFSCDSNIMPASYQLKFHNDCWTSTTDLHCFGPYMPPMPASVTSAAQVETPIEIKCCCHKDPGNSVDCMLNFMKEYNKIVRPCKCNRIQKDSPSIMSIDKSTTDKSKISSSNNIERKSSSCMSIDKLNKKRESKKNELFCERCNTAHKTEDLNKKQNQKESLSCMSIDKLSKKREPKKNELFCERCNTAHKTEDLNKKQNQKESLSCMSIDKLSKKREPKRNELFCECCNTANKTEDLNKKQNQKESLSCMSIDKLSKKREPKKNVLFCERCVDNTANKIEDVNKKQNQKVNKTCQKHSQHTKPQNCEDAVQNTDEPGGPAVQTADKVVVTYSDQASSVPAAAGQTQTECRCWSTTDVKELKKSKTLRTRRRRKPASTEKIIGVYDYSTSESFCTICNSDTSRGSFN